MPSVEELEDNARTRVIAQSDQVDKLPDEYDANDYKKFKQQIHTLARAQINRENRSEGFLSLLEEINTHSNKLSQLSEIWPDEIADASAAEKIKNERNEAIANSSGAKQGLLEVILEKGPKKAVKAMVENYVDGARVRKPLDDINLGTILKATEGRARRVRSAQLMDVVTDLAKYNFDWNTHPEEARLQYENWMRVCQDAGMPKAGAVSMVTHHAINSVEKYALTSKIPEYLELMSGHRYLNEADKVYEMSAFTAFMDDVVETDKSLPRLPANSEVTTGSVTGSGETVDVLHAALEDVVGENNKLRDELRDARQDASSGAPSLFPISSVATGAGGDDVSRNSGMTLPEMETFQAMATAFKTMSSSMEAQQKTLDNLTRRVNRDGGGGGRDRGRDRNDGGTWVTLSSDDQPCKHCAGIGMRRRCPKANSDDDCMASKSYKGDRRIFAVKRAIRAWEAHHNKKYE